MNRERFTTRQIWMKYKINTELGINLEKKKEKEERKLNIITESFKKIKEETIRNWLKMDLSPSPSYQKLNELIRCPMQHLNLKKFK